MSAIHACRIALGVALSSALLAATIPTAGAMAAEELDGSLIITAETTASVDVVLPVGLTVESGPPFQPPLNVAIEGAGRATGIALRGLDGEREELSVIRWNRCAEPGCLGDEPSYSLGGGEPGLSDGRTTRSVSAGRYRAYILTDGAPVRVTISLPVGGSRHEIPATGPARAVVDAPTMTSLAGGMHQAAATSEEFGPGSGTVLQYVEVETGSSSIGQTTQCLYSGLAPPSEAYLVRCPGANSINSTATHMAGSRTERMSTIWWSLAAGPYHAGTALLRTESPADVLAVQVFVEYL